MPSRSKVAPLRPNSLPPLRVASTSQRGSRIDGSRNEVWLCPGYDGNGNGVVLYVKPGLSVRQAMVEALAAQIGQCMSLPCPDPYIVTASPQHVGRPRGAKIFAFGSAQVGIGARPVLDSEVLLGLLETQKLRDPLATFDEFIANPVRGPRDIVFDPAHGAIIIDHEGAMEASTKPGQSVSNWLADRVLERLTTKDRPVFLKRLRSKAAALHSIGIGAAPSAVQFDQRGVPLYNELAAFLVERLTHLDRLLSERVLPGQAYIQEHPSEDDASGRATDL
jgi:hypothetical protein